MENGPGPLRCLETTQGILKKSLISSADHERVLQQCADIPDQKPVFEFPINHVGISEKTLWVRLPEGAIPFDASVSVNLSGSSRGIHMSRIEGEIADLYPVQFEDIGQYALQLARNVLKTQNASIASVQLEGKLPKINQTPATNVDSIDTIQAMAKAVAQDDSEALTIGIGINHITACPCTQAYNQVLFRQNGNIPLPTHTQRSTTWLYVETHQQRPIFGDILSCLLGSLNAIYDRLKRPDEAEVILQAHTFPQFAEDTVRQILKSVGLLLGHCLPEKNQITVDSHSLESIHHHNVHCRVETTMEEILKRLP